MRPRRGEEPGQPRGAAERSGQDHAVGPAVPHGCRDEHGEDQVADQYRLDQRERPEVQRDDLKDDPEHVQDDGYEPHRPVQQVEDEPHRERVPVRGHLLGAALLEDGRRAVRHRGAHGGTDRGYREHATDSSGSSALLW